MIDYLVVTIKLFIYYHVGEEINDFVSFLNVSDEIIQNKLINRAGPYTKFIMQRNKLKKLQVSSSLKHFYSNLLYLFIQLIVH